jgi:ABC-type Fe3+-citrate transport system substrate-binding protein
MIKTCGITRSIIIITLSVCLAIAAGCSSKNAESKAGQEDGVVQLEAGKKWTVDGQWELTVTRALRMGGSETNITVMYEVTNTGHTGVSDRYDGLVILPRAFTDADLRLELPVNGIDAWGAKTGITVRRNRTSFSSADGVTPIHDCYFVFTQIDDSGKTHTGIYYVSLK